MLNKPPPGKYNYFPSKTTAGRAAGTAILKVKI